VKISFARQTKEAIKTALAMTIAYGIALQMNWDKPYWAGFAVAFVSLATVGQSFNKAAMRMFGTLVASVAALTLIAYFAQDRWLFMLFLSAWVGYCTYMMEGTSHQYFWNICGFVCIIISMSGGPDSANAFNLAIVRCQETGLGILVYSLVAILIWPTRSRADFDAATHKLAATQRQLYQALFTRMTSNESPASAETLQKQLLQAQTGFSQLLAAAETDTYEVWEMRQQWQKFEDTTADFTATVAGWQSDIPELQGLDIQSIMPTLETFGSELEKRFSQVETMLAGQPPMHRPSAVFLPLDKTAVQSLSHFHRAALAVMRTRLLHLEKLSRAFFETVFDIQNYGQKNTVPEAYSRPHTVFVIDPERLTCVVRVMITLWVTYSALIYVPDMPGGPGMVSIAGVFAMLTTAAPQQPVNKMFKPIAGGILFGAAVHMFVMPRLSGFLELGLLIFAVTFGICYLFSAPQQGLSKLFGLAMFVKIANITNQQAYSFTSIATTVIMFTIIFLLLAVIANLPFSSRPEKMFLRLLGRYFRSSNYLIHAMGRDTQKMPTRLQSWRRNFHVQQLISVPKKLTVWTKCIDNKALAESSPQKAQAVVTDLQTLSHRMQELLKECGRSRSPYLATELEHDIIAWRRNAEKIMQTLATKNSAGNKEALNSRLAALVNQLEQRISTTLDTVGDKKLSDHDRKTFYRQLGVFRGVSEALVEYAGSAHALDWNRWREERF